LGIVIAAVIATGQARSFAIATTMMGWLGTRLDSAVNRFYRLLRNDRVDYTAFLSQWARLLVRGEDRHLLIFCACSPTGSSAQRSPPPSCATEVSVASAGSHCSASCASGSSSA
jgi:hypothetical protein